MASFNVGDKVRVVGTLKQADGTLIDPTAVYGWFVDPLGTKNHYQYGFGAQITRDSTGVYFMDIDTDVPGTFYYGFYGTGTAKAASVDGEFSVSRSKR